MRLCSFDTLRRISLSILVVAMLGEASPAFAVEIPGAADIGRVKPNQNMLTPPTVAPETPTPVTPNVDIPEGVEKVHLTLKHLEIRGVTAFDPEVFERFYSDLLDQDITLDKIWPVAAKITQYYRSHGYFLSQAIVPAQEIEGGSVIIQVVEGYVGEVTVPEDLRDARLVQDSVRRVTSERPLRLPTLESALLRLNDLPGVAVRSVLEPLEGSGGAAKLTLIRQEKRPAIALQLDDYGSLYAGPGQAGASLRGSLIPLQETSLFGITSLPFSELRYGSIQHRVPLGFAADLILQANHSASAPGYTLRDFDVRGNSTDVSAGLNYSLVRQRHENLQLHSLVEWRNSSTDLLGTKLTRDRIRVLRVGARYDHADRWNGVTSYDVTVSHGLSTWGASGANDPNVSRAGAKPSFTKEELTVSRWQELGNNVNLLVSAMAQGTSDVLFSSEEIGYGGQTYGRAYDSSELTGNQGIMAMMELRYDGIAAAGGIRSQPYVYYDIGEVWNDAVRQPKSISAASAGFGLRLTSDWHVSADFTIAQPLTRPAAAPLRGSGNSPRYLAKVLFNY